MLHGGNTGDSSPTATLDRPLIVHARARWGSDAHISHRLFTQLARVAPVLFLEPPSYDGTRVMAYLELTTPAPAVTRAVPHLPPALRAEYDRSVDLVKSLVLAATGIGGALANVFDAPLQWFETPLPALTMLGTFSEVGVVYDCTVPIATASIAADVIADRERTLMREADLLLVAQSAALNAIAPERSHAHVVLATSDAESLSLTIRRRIRDALASRARRIDLAREALRARRAANWATEAWPNSAALDAAGDLTA